mgnify:CR=1 FL=1
MILRVNAAWARAQAATEGTDERPSDGDRPL